MKYNNPIISGFYPDPSICRVNDDYYLVTSSFEYFPGVPLFHSRDLVHWQQIGHCLNRPAQLPLAKTPSSAGIFAPTIRYHNGVFYMITTNVSVGKHFIVTTTDPHADWSDPLWIDQTGIDPSLAFLDDKVYFSWTMHGAIYQAELDVLTGQCLTEPRLIWTGTGGRYPEAPHLYHINGWYYLMIAEGGTEYGHMETIARSSSPWGPFEPCPHNPILTHRNRGSHVIQATGHADFVQTPDGQWWTVFLGFRQSRQYGQFHHLGRETFLAPVTWNADGWPVVNGTGTVDLEMEAEGLTEHGWPIPESRDDFDSSQLGLVWNFLRNPYPETWSLTEHQSWLRLKGSAVTLNDLDSPAFVGRRQQHFDCIASARLAFSPTQSGHEAGLTVLMNEKHHYEIAVVFDQGSRDVIVRKRIGDLSAVVARNSISDGDITLKIQADAERYHFAYALDDADFKPLADGLTCYLTSEVASGFTGVYIGMYATGNGSACTVPADFDWFDYRPL